MFHLHLKVSHEEAQTNVNIDLPDLLNCYICNTMIIVVTFMLVCNDYAYHMDI